MDKEVTIEIRDRLVDFAGRIGYQVELESKMPEYLKKGKKLNKKGSDGRPAGDCNYHEHRIRVREGKGLQGQVSTLIHEITHALGMGGPSSYSNLGGEYLELVCESVTQFVTQMLGIDRTHKTAPRVFGGYGFKGFLVSPVTQTITNIFADELGLEHPVLNQEEQMFVFKKV